MNNLQFLFATIFSSVLVVQSQQEHVPKQSVFQEVSLEQFSPLPSTQYAQTPRHEPLDRIQQQNQQIILEVELHERQRKIKTKQDFGLPSNNHKKGTSLYRSAYLELNMLDPAQFSIKEAIIIVENAFLENQLKQEAFNKFIKQSSSFIQNKIKELGVDKNDNVTKNLMLYRFFSDTLEIKSRKLKHLPITYDFDDYWGREDWTKMFVSKLLKTGSGQCSSMPRLYLILAQELGAEAFLSLSPNHSFIRFRDNDENWYNVELTNGMFTTDSFVLQSGFIKAEALQQKIYMQELNSKQLLSQSYVDLAAGYIHKYGYDSFVEEVILKALSLYPKSITANLTYGNFLTEQFEYSCSQVGINPRNKNELQHIRNFPELMEMIQKTNKQYAKIDALGYEYMSTKDYQKWLDKLLEAKQQQESKRFKALLNSNTKTKG